MTLSVRLPDDAERRLREAPADRVFAKNRELYGHLA